MTRGFKHSKKFLGSVSRISPRRILVLFLIATVFFAGLQPLSNVSAAVLQPTVIEYFDDITASVAPNIDIIHAGQTVIWKLVITNPNASTTLTGINIQVGLPPSVQFILPITVTGACSDTNYSATNSGVTINDYALYTLSDTPGGTLAGGASCTISAPVTSYVPGTYSHTTGAVNAANASGSNNTGSAILTVLPILTGPTITKAFNPPVVTSSGATSQLTITIPNPNSGVLSDLTNVDLTDSLPAGLTISGSATANNCGTGGAPGILSNTTTSITLTNGKITGGGPACTITATVSASGVGSYTNTINKDDLKFNGGTNPNTATATLYYDTPLVQTKSFSTPFDAGAPAKLTILITNPAVNKSSQTNIDFTDNLPASMVISSPANLTTSPADCNGSGTAVFAAPGSATVSINSVDNAHLAPGETCTITVDVTTATIGNYTNTPTKLTGTDNGVIIPGTMNPATVLVTGTSKNILVANKSFNPVIVGQGAPFQMTITLDNQNGIAANNVSFTDDLLSAGAGLIFNNPTNIQSTNCGVNATAVAGGTTLALSGGTIPANTTCTITVNVTGTVPGTFINKTSPITTVNVGITPPVNGSVTINSNLQPPTVSKTFLTPFIDPNVPSQLQFTITNPASFPQFGVTFTDNLPSPLQVAPSPNITVTPGCAPGFTAANIQASGGTISSTGNLILPAGPSTCTVTVDVVSPVIGLYTNPPFNIGSGPYPGGSTSVINNQIDIDQSALPLTVNKAFSTTPATNPVSIVPGGVATITFTISNPDTFPIYGATFTDLLPTGSLGGRMVVAPTPNIVKNGTGCVFDTITATSDTQIVSLTGPNTKIPATSSCTISVDVTAPTDGTYTNPAFTITSITVPNPPTTSNTPSVIVVGNPSILPATISKVYGAATIPLNGTTTLTFTIHNPNDGTGVTNPVALTNYKFVDGFPSGVKLANPTIAANICDIGSPGAFSPVLSTGAASITYIVPSLAAGATCTVTVNVKGLTAGDTQNVIGLNTSDNSGDGPVPGQVTLTIVAPPTIKKAFDLTVPNPLTAGSAGYNTGLTFTITNPSANTVAVTGVTFTDVLPDVLPALPPGSGPTQMTAVSVTAPDPVTCGAASWTITTTNVATPNDTLSFSGGDIPANTSCVLKAIIFTPATGKYDNTSGNISGANSGGGGNTGKVTLNTRHSLPSLTINKTFSLTTLPVNSVATMKIVIVNPADKTQQGVAFTDKFPTGLVFESPANEVGNCFGGNVTVDTTTNTLSLTGGTLDATGLPNDNCTITVDVTSASAKSYNNSTQASSPLGGTGGTTSATITFVLPATVTKSITNSIVPAGQTALLTINLTNPNNITALSGVSVDDTSMDGITVADPAINPPSFSADCGSMVFNPALTTGDTSIHTTGGFISAAKTCVIKVVVTAPIGIHTNTINNGDVKSKNGGPSTSVPPPTAKLTVRGYSIGNKLWFDNNNNGHFDLGESPVVGAKVDLLNSSDGSPVFDTNSVAMVATTDANGYYRFDGLLAGSYLVRVEASNWAPKTAINPAGPLNGYASSTNNIPQTGTTTPDSFDNGIDLTNTPLTDGVTSPVIKIGPGLQPLNEDNTVPASGSIISRDSTLPVGAGSDANDNLTVDFGFYKLSVGDTVWNDNGGSSSNIPANVNNGKQDANEPGIPGVIVQLLKGGVFVAQATTDGNGNYFIDQQTDNNGKPTGNPLVAGSDYTIVIPKGQAALTGFESSTDLSSTFNPTIIGNGVNADDNGKGTSSANTADTVSDAFSLNVFGYNNTAGSVQKPNALTDNPTLDFGFHQVVANTYSIGNRVWLDDGAGNGTANNGVQDGTEKGLDGVRVLLYNTDATGNPTTLVQTQTTSGGGYYRFDSVPAGTTGAPLTYMVIVDRNNSPILNGLITSNNTYVDYNATGDKQNKGAQTPLSAVVPNGVPSGVVTLSNPSTTTPKSTNPVTGEPDVTNTTPFGTNGPNGDTFDVLTVDFGFYQPIGQPYSIGNRVWLDNGVGGTLLSANDGIQNGNETGIPNVKVDLFAADASGKATGPILQTQQTDGNGYYRFDNIDLTKTGNKYVVVVDTSVASSPALNGLKLSTMPVPTDYSATGDQHNKGTVISLPADLTAIGLTSGVSSGVITITNPATPPTSTNPVTGEPDVTGSGQGAHSSAGDTNDILTADFGFYSDVTTGYSIGNRVWLDNGASPNDGIQQLSDEAGIPQMPLKLFVADASGAPTGSPIQTISTDANGYYRFDGVTPGSYVVVMDLPSFNASSAVTKYKLTGASFTDYQKDQQNVGKQTVLDNSSPLPGGVVSPLILITNPATAPTSTNPVLNEKDISTGLGAHGPSLDVNDILTADFGLVAIPANSFSIGNRVWLDNGGGVPANVNNGKQDANEPGIPNVTVYLYASNAGAPTGAALQTTVTDNSGYYRFDGVAAGKYVVVVDQDAIKSPGLVGLLPSTFPSTLTPANSTLFTTASDQFTKGGPLSGLGAVPTGVVSKEIDTANAAVTLTEPDVVAAGVGAHGPLGDGSDILTADFGFYVDATKAYSIGNRVWFDNGAGGGTPNDGKQNGTEPGIPNVKLELFYADKAGSPIGTVPLATTTTDTNGYYRFDGVTPGDYVVVVDKVGSTSLNGFTPSTPSFTDYTTNGDKQNKGLLTPLTQTSPVPGGTVSSLITVAPPTTPLPLTEPDVIVGNPSFPTADHAANGDNHDLLTADFSYITAPTTYSIGNRIWNDLNKDGIQQSNEPGIGGVSVLLYKSDTNGNPTTRVGNVTTDGNGFYRFDGLIPGDYVVIVDVANSPALSGSTLTKNVITTPNTNTTDAENNGIATTTPLISGGVPSGKISIGARPSEPIGELVPASDAAGSVFTTSAAPQSSDDHGNLTIDFGFILPTANVYAFDPVMVKLVDPSLALPGEPVTFTITISNFGTVAAPNVIITDPLPSRLIFTGADTPQGSFSANGNTVTFLLGTLAANQVISVHVHAKIDPNVAPPVDLTNTATAVLNGKTITATTLNASATLHVTGGKLPNTGEHPAPQSDPSDSLLTGFLVGLGAIIVAFRMRQLWRITR